jgi:hypothetical protein
MLYAKDVLKTEILACKQFTNDRFLKSNIYKANAKNKKVGVITLMVDKAKYAWKALKETKVTFPVTTLSFTMNT